MRSHRTPITRFVARVTLVAAIALLPRAGAAQDGAPASAAGHHPESESDILSIQGLVHAPVSAETRQPARPKILPALYVTFAGLQAYDGYSTLRGVGQGARESNPLLSGFAGNKAAMWALKGGVTATSIYAAERLWKGHRRGAVVLMLVSNSVVAAVAARNAAVLRRQP